MTRVMFFARAAGRGRLGSLVQDPGEVDGLPVELERMRVGAREEEELVDENGEPVGVPLDDPEVALAGRRERPLGRVERHLEIAAERRERRSQLVGGGRDELVLEAVELEQALVLGGQLRGDAREGVGLLLQEGGAPAEFWLRRWTIRPVTAATVVRTKAPRQPVSG